MKTPPTATAGAVAGMNWKTTLALGAVVLAIAGLLVWSARRAPKAAADAAGEVVDSVTSTVGRQIDKLEETITDPTNRSYRWANAAWSPILGTNDYTGKPNTIGSGLEEASRTVSGWISGIF